MSAIAAVSAILDRLSATNDRDHRFIALKDLHAALSRLSPPAVAAAASSSAASASASTAAQPLPLDTTSETRLSSNLLLSLLTSASELQELTVSCLSLLPPVYHAPSLLSLLTLLLAYVLDPSLPLPGERSGRQQQWKGRDYEDEEEAEEGGGSEQVVDRRQAAISALAAVFPRLRRDDAELRSAGEKLLPPLMDAVEKERRKGGGGAERALELQLLDLISVFLSQHAAAVAVLHADLLQLLQALLSSSSKQTQKAAIVCIAALAPSLSPQLFASVISALLARYGKGDAAAYGLIAALAQSSPSALAAFAPAIVSQLGSSLSLRLPVDSNTAVNDDRAGCLMALESLVRGCGEEVLPGLLELLPALGACLAYDPNLVGDGDEEELQQDDGDDRTEGGSDSAGMQDDDGGEAEAADDEYAEAMSDEDVVDEEDTSSRVRRAASKCLIAVLTAISSLLSSSSSSPSKSKRYLSLHSTISRLVERITPLLLSRFHERTDHIQVDVLQAAVLAVRAAVALRLSLTTLFPQPQLSKAITALLSAHGKAKARLSSSTLQLLTSSYRTLALLLSSLPPATLLSQLRPTLQSISSVMARALPLCSSSPAAAETMVAAWELVTALLVQVTEAEWVTEVEAVTLLLVDSLRGGTGRVAVQALGTAEELIEMLSHALADRAKQAKDASLLPMTLLDAACGVETEEERRNSWPSRGDEPAAAAGTPSVSSFLPSVTSSLSAKELTSITASASRIGPLLQAALLQALQAGGGDRELKAAALNAVGLLYSHLPVLGNNSESAELWRTLQPHVDSPITRLEAVRAVARVARAAAFLTPDPASALQPALLQITASLVGYLKHTDRTLQHFALSAVNTVTLRVLSLSLHLAAADTSSLSAISVPEPLQPLASALTAAFAPLHSLLSQHADWLQELESVLTLLSHVVLLSMSCSSTREQTVRTVSTETLPSLLSVVSELPSIALSYSLSLAIASVPALYFFASPPSPSLSSLSSQLSQAFASTSHHHRRALCMLMAASVLSSSLSSTRGYSEVKAEIGWKQRPRADDDIRAIVTQLLQSATSRQAGSAQTETDRLWALGVLGEVGRVHSLSQSVTPQLSSLLQPTGDAGADVAAATALGLVTIGNPTEHFPLLLSRLSSPTAASTALYLYSLHELLHHLAFHQVVALSHPFNTATVKPHSIPFPSSSLLLLIQALSAAIPEPVLPILFSHSVSTQQAVQTLSVSSLIRLMALFPAPTLTGVQAVIQQTPELLSSADAEAAQRQSLLVQSLLSALSSFVSVYLSVSSVTSLPSKAIDAEHRHSSDVRPKILPPSTVFTAQLFSLLPFIIPLLSSPSLPLRAGATSLLSSVASHAPQLLTPHLSLLFSSFAAFSLPSPLFTVRKQYGPLVREVDTAMEGRLEGWEMLRLVLDTVDMNSRWFTDTEAPAPERDAVIGSVADSLTAGLDDAVEVQVAVLPLLGAVLRCLPLQPAHVLRLAKALRGKVDSVVRADAVGSEVQQHAEMVQAALKAGKEMEAALAADRTLASVRDSSDWKALLVSMQRRESAAAASPVLPA